MANNLDFEREGYLSLWTGDFASRDEFEFYLEENIGEDDDVDTPLNKFAEDIGVGFYDHDLQEAEYSDQGQVSIEEILAPFSYSSSYIDNAVSSAKRAGASPANSVIVLVNTDYSGETKDSAPIRFIGVFPYDENASPVAQ